MGVTRYIAQGLVLSMTFLSFALVIGVCTGRPQLGFQSTQNTRQFNPNQFRNSDPIEDLSQGVHGLSNGARATAVLVERGGGAGVDILSQFGQLFESVSSQSQ